VLEPAQLSRLWHLPSLQALPASLVCQIPYTTCTQHSTVLGVMVAHQGIICSPDCCEYSWVARAVVYRTVPRSWSATMHDIIGADFKMFGGSQPQPCQCADHMQALLLQIVGLCQPCSVRPS
jgi:hypothetical protein